MRAGIFPGQGNQSVGMGKDLYDKCPIVGMMYDRANAITGIDVKSISFEGPEQAQFNTLNQQLCTFALSCAIFEQVTQDYHPKFDFFAGHSIGEYAALYAAGVIPFDVGLVIVKKRGELMQSISFDRPSLVRVSRADPDEIHKFCESTGGDIRVALYNSPLITILGGLPNHIDQYWDQIPGRKSRLNVAGPFHIPHYASIQEEFRDFITDYQYGEPNAPVYSNHSVTPYTTKNAVDQLVSQLTAPVLWKQIIWEQLIQGNTVRKFIEMGPGSSLSTLITKSKQTPAKVTVSSVNNTTTLENLTL